VVRRRSPRIAIVGAGIGGLAAALAFHRRGIEAEIYEQVPELREIGAGLNLSPNTLKAFRHLGVEDAAVAIGYQAEYQFIRSWRSGRIITKQKRAAGIAARFGAEFMTIHRADLSDVLRDALPDSAVHLGAACTAVETRGDVAVARFADGREVEADAVIGADGIRSAVRESLLGADTPRFTGCVCWRGLVPREAVANDPMALEMTSWWGPHGHFIQYPVRRGELINWVAHYDSDAWTGESWTHECDREEILETYARWHPAIRRLIAAGETYYKWALFDRDPLERWGQGRVTLLGDAAHPMLPYLAQGAGMAVEDGCVLADLVAANPNDIEGALSAYQELRKPRTTRAQLGSRERARVNHLTSPWARLKRDTTLAWRRYFGTADNTMYQAAWLYDYDVATAATPGTNAAVGLGS
jgi:salicylate hydroxylase